MTITTDRMIPTAVDQPEHYGKNFPFIENDADTAWILSDMHLSYQDPDETFVAPFRVKWMYGFGSLSASQPGGIPLPKHQYDLIVADANGTTVFDSTTAPQLQVRHWGTRWDILQWITPTGVLRAVRYTQRNVSLRADDVPLHLLPAAGTLDERVAHRMPRAVYGLLVNDQLLTGQIDIIGGYNMQITPGAARTKEGTPLIQPVTLNGTPGGGLGLVPGCSPPVDGILTINGQKPDAAGNLVLSLTDCFHARPAVASVSPTMTVGGAASTVTTLLGSMQVDNDCAPCCSCSDYVNTYVALYAIWEKLQAIDTEAHTVRDLLNTNITRWNASATCRQNNPLTLVADSFCPCTTGVLGAVCNTGTTCIVGAQLQFTFSGTPGNIVLGQTILNGQKQFTMGGGYPIFVAELPTIYPGENGSVRFQMNFSGCASGDPVGVQLSVLMPPGTPQPSNSVLTSSSLLLSPPPGFDCAGNALPPPTP